MSLTIDAMDVLYGGKAEVFALVSNDSDFTPFAIRLREVAKLYGDEKGFVNLGQSGNIIIQKNLDIKVSGHSKLGKFLSAFPNLYEVGNNSYRCK